MAQILYFDRAENPDYHGLGSIFEYTNDDGNWVRTNCGQAAALTLLTHYRKLPTDAQRARQIFARLEEHYPPDNLGGYLGTSRRQVTHICRKHGLPVVTISGMAELQESLAAERPVMVMLGVPAGRFLSLFDLPGGHWMVAYGFDRDFVYLTNYGRMPWDEFLAGWSSFVPRLISMWRKGLAVRN
jgi:hypothetical protein